MRAFVLVICALVAALPARATETLGLAAPAEVVKSGLLAHVLPRYSLKTGTRVAVDPAGTMVLADAPPGRPVLRRGDVTYHLRPGPDPRAADFVRWLGSEVGRRTVAGYTPPSGAAFEALDATAAEDDAPRFAGDVEEGAALSLKVCGRCHVVGEVNRMNGLGSTPSFAMLRGLPDWDSRFQRFYVLRPHGAFTQIDGVTAPFDPARPSPIAPVELTLDELDAILAFVEATEAADLGAPLHLQ